MKKSNSKTEYKVGYIESIEEQVLLISKLGLEAKRKGNIELANICAYFVYDVLDWIRLQKTQEHQSLNVYPGDSLLGVERFVEKYQAEAA